MSCCVHKSCCTQRLLYRTVGHDPDGAIAECGAQRISVSLPLIESPREWSYSTLDSVEALVGGDASPTHLSVFPRRVLHEVAVRNGCAHSMRDRDTPQSAEQLY